MMIILASPLLLQDLATPNMHKITQRAACSSSRSENPSFTSIVSLSFFSKVLYGQQRLQIYTISTTLLAREKYIILKHC